MVAITNEQRIIDGASRLRPGPAVPMHARKSSLDDKDACERIQDRRTLIRLLNNPIPVRR